MGHSFFKRSKISLLCLGASACLPLTSFFNLSSAEASPIQAVGTGTVQRNQQVQNPNYGRRPVQYSQHTQYRQQPVRNQRTQQVAQNVPLDSVYRQAYNRAAASGYNASQADQYAREVVAAYQRRAASQNQVPRYGTHAGSEQQRVQRQQELAKMQANAALWNRIEQQRRQAWANSAGYRQAVAQTNRQLRQVQGQAAQYQPPVQHQQTQQVAQNPVYTGPAQTTPPTQVDYSRTFASGPAAGANVQNAGGSVQKNNNVNQAVAQQVPGSSSATRPVSVLETGPASTYIPPASSGSRPAVAATGSNFRAELPAAQGTSSGVSVPSALSQGTPVSQGATLPSTPAPLPNANPIISTQPAPGGVGQGLPAAASNTLGNAGTLPTTGSTAANSDLLASPIISVENSPADAASTKTNSATKAAGGELFGRTPKPLPSSAPKSPAKSAPAKKKESSDDMELKLEGYIGKQSGQKRHYAISPLAGNQAAVRQVGYQQSQLQEGMAPQLTGQLQPSPELTGQTLPAPNVSLQAPSNGLQAPGQIGLQAPGRLPASNQQLGSQPTGNFGDLPQSAPPTSFQSPDPNSQWTGQSRRRPITRPAIAVKSPRGVRLKAASSSIDRRRGQALANQPYSLQDAEKQDNGTQPQVRPNNIPLGQPQDLGNNLAADSGQQSCEELRDRLKKNSIRSVSLDLYVPLAEAGRNVADQREWKDKDGNTIVVGRAISGSSLVINVDDGNGLIRPIDLHMLSEQDRQFALSLIDLPAECGLGTEALVARSFVPSTVTWYASNLCHKPLYFEDIQLERYGHTKGPIRQPVRSAANFLIRTALLPYQMTLHPPNECQYPLGLYRPGNCAPYLRTPFPWNRRALVRQASFVGGGISLIP